MNYYEKNESHNEKPFLRLAILTANLPNSSLIIRKKLYV